MRRALLVVPLVLFAAGCSSDPVAGPVAGVSAPPPSTTAAGPPVVLDAAGVVARFKAAGLPVGSVIVYTAATDENHLLGRPGGYVSKAAFTDSRVRASDARDHSAGSVDLGGSVEVFVSNADAVAREEYLQKALRAAPVLGTEYDYVAGGVLVRVSQVLTPDQAAGYKTAMGA